MQIRTNGPINYVQLSPDDEAYIWTLAIQFLEPEGNRSFRGVGPAWTHFSGAIEGIERKLKEQTHVETLPVHAEPATESQALDGGDCPTDEEVEALR